ncbi:MAG: hypothetical protein GXY61_00705 [Lentisphaerae bacterium]|jgi:type III secretion system FlhB-like substrate exporter|nr:hypothetical protein [Lentisphaerota bacterium]
MTPQLPSQINPLFRKIFPPALDYDKRDPSAACFIAKGCSVGSVSQSIIVAAKGANGKMGE